MKYIAVTLCCIMLLTCGQAEAATQSMCPDKVLDSGTIEGIFLGVECGDYCHATIKLPNGEEFSLFANEETTEKAFGKGTGQKVSVTYELRQYWEGEGMYCNRAEFFASGKLLAAPPAQTAQDSSSLASDIAMAQQAAEKGDAFAQLGLGLMYLTGNGVPKDNAKAEQWIQKAAAQGDKSAQQTLQMLKAAANGDTRAQKALEMLHSDIAESIQNAQIQDQNIQTEQTQKNTTNDKTSPEKDSGGFFGLFTSKSSGDKYVETVKEGYLAFDESTTVGNVLDNYGYITSANWSSFEDQQKRKIVQFEGALDQIKIAQELSQPKYSLALLSALSSTDTLKKLLADKKSKLYRTQWNLVVQFKIMKGDEFEISYTGFRNDNGEEEARNVDQMIEVIYENEVIAPQKLLSLQ